MAQNKIIKIPPQFLPAAAGNLLNPALGSVAGPVGFTATQPYLILKHIRITNKTAGALAATLYLGATGGSAAGTEFQFAGKSIPANDSVEWFGQARLDAADFLTGIGGAATSLVITMEAEIGFS